MKKLNLCLLKIIGLLSLCLLPCCFFAFPCYAETTYTITATEVQQLKYNFNKLSELNTQSQKESQELNEKLKLSENKLIQQEKTLVKLTETSKMQEQSLKTANEFCDKLSNDLRQANKKVHKYTRQRNIYAGLFVSAVTAYLIEKRN